MELISQKSSMLNVRWSPKYTTVISNKRYESLTGEYIHENFHCCLRESLSLMKLERYITPTNPLSELPKINERLQSSEHIFQ